MTTTFQTDTRGRAFWSNAAFSRNFYPVAPEEPEPGAPFVIWIVTAGMWDAEYHLSYLLEQYDRLGNQGPARYYTREGYQAFVEGKYALDVAALEESAGYILARYPARINLIRLHYPGRWVIDRPWPDIVVTWEGGYSPIGWNGSGEYPNLSNFEGRMTLQTVQRGAFRACDAGLAAFLVGLMNQQPSDYGPPIIYLAPSQPYGFFPLDADPNIYWHESGLIHFPGWPQSTNLPWWPWWGEADPMRGNYFQHQTCFPVERAYEEIASRLPGLDDGHISMLFGQPGGFVRWGICEDWYTAAGRTLGDMAGTLAAVGQHLRYYHTVRP